MSRVMANDTAGVGSTRRLLTVSEAASSAGDSSGNSPPGSTTVYKGPATAWREDKYSKTDECATHLVVPSALSTHDQFYRMRGRTPGPRRPGAILFLDSH
jgi:hypothetical protein